MCLLTEFVARWRSSQCSTRLTGTCCSTTCYVHTATSFCWKNISKSTHWTSTPYTCQPSFVHWRQVRETKNKLKSYVEQPVDLRSVPGKHRRGAISHHNKTSPSLVNPTEAAPKESFSTIHSKYGEEFAKKASVPQMFPEEWKLSPEMQRISFIV